MATDVRRQVENCPICAKLVRNYQKETLTQDKLPQNPFERVGMDIFELGVKEYLSIYDAYSNFLLKAIFATIGYPTRSIVRNSGISQMTHNLVLTQKYDSGIKHIKSQSFSSSAPMEG